LAGLIDKRRAAGGQVPEAWFKRGQQVAVEAKLADEAATYSRWLLGEANTLENWRRAFQVVALLNTVDEHSSLDLLRLMRQTGALEQRQQFVTYVDAAARNGLPSEVLAVLKDGVAKGVYSAGDQFY